ncbi:hypothetical protein AOLI_G00188340 [Acnodon oligacanthus]
MNLNTMISLFYTIVIFCHAACAGEYLTKLHTSSNNINRFYKLLEFSVFNTPLPPGSLPAPAHIFISARVGSSAVLPCDWRNVSTQSPHVEWRTISETVFERRGEELYQGEGYEGRVDVPEDHLLKGDCSLELKNIRPEDAGVYESFLLVRRTKRSLRYKSVFLQNVELTVDDDAGVNSHYPQVIALSLLSSSLFHLF